MRQFSIYQNALAADQAPEMALRALGDGVALWLGGIGTDSRQGKLSSYLHGLDAKTQLEKGVEFASGGGKALH